MVLDFSLFLNPVILAILALFAGILVYYINSVRYINASLHYLTNILRSFKKGNIVFTTFCTSCVL